MKEILVVDIMTREPITIKPDTNLLECAKKMVRKRVGSLLLVDNKKLVGFIDEKDILWALIKKSKKDLAEIKAIDISPKKIATIKPSFTLKEAIQKMKKLKFDRLPVIHDKELVGMITVKDILNFHPEVYPELDEFAKIREETKKLKRIKKAKGGKSTHQGICEQCGKQDILLKTNGMSICEACKNLI
ncbi:MAG TPA: CBS domain-containing protein [Candidatus Paceibacterota bacterium]|nr:CBS domain-containing protein [Candidatus Paceibacterota bacterium]